MSRTDDRVARLESEIDTLKKQLNQSRQGVFPEKTLNSLFVHAREVVLYIANDEKLTVETISDSITVYGYIPGDFTSGKLKWPDILHPDDCLLFVEYINEQRHKNRESLECEYRILTKPGDPVWVACVFLPERNAEGKVTHFLMKIKDINKQKLNEEKLHDANENLIITLKSIGETVIQTDTAGRIERLNSAAERLIGIINLKARNKKLDDLIRFSNTSDFAVSAGPLKMAMETNKAVLIDEIFMKCGDNDKYFRVSCNVSPIRTGRNKPVTTGYVLAIKDLTEIYDMLQAAQESEARIQESETTIRSIFDHSVDGMLLADQNGIIREWSTGYERISGISKEEAIGKPVWEIVLKGLPPEQCDSNNRQQLTEEVKQVVAGMKQKMITRHVINQKTGSHRIVNALYFPVAMQGRTMIGAISRDVTEEVRAREQIINNEQKLLFEKERLQTLGDNLPDGCLFQFMLDPNAPEKQGFTYLSQMWHTITGLSVEETLADFDALQANLHPDDISVFDKSVEESAATMNKFVFEFRFFRSDKQMLWLKVSSVPHMEGGLIVWDGFITDITERKLAEQALIVERDRLQALGDHFPNGCLFRFKMDMRTGTMSLDYVSATWEKTLGVSAEESMADIRVVFEHIHSDDMPRFVDAVYKSVNTLENIDVEVRYYHPEDGREGWYQIASHPHRENNITYSDGFILDITARKQAEQKLFYEKDRLQSLGDNLHNGCLFRFQIEEKFYLRPDAEQTWLQNLQLSYASAAWEKISNVPLADAEQNVTLPFLKIYQEDLAFLGPEMFKSQTKLTSLNVEIRYHYTDDETRWFQISSTPRREAGMVITDGFILDITERKNIETELAVYREELERLVKERTEELEATNEELYATNEELYATNEEFAVTNEELHTRNDQLRNEIAARMEIMRKLEDSESKMRNFIQQSFEGIMILNEEGRVMEWNNSLVRITGISREEAVGNFEWDLFNRFVPEESQTEDVFGKIRRSRLEELKLGSNLQPVVQDSILTMPDNSEVYIYGTLFPIEMAGTCYFGIIMRDVTEQKLADMELEQYRTQLEQMVETKTRELVVSQERLVSLSNNLPGGVIYQLMDRNMESTWFTYMSAYFADMFEISVEEIMADPMPFYMSIAPEYQQKLIAEYAEANRNGSVDIEYRITTRSGKSKWIHMRSSNHHVEDGIRVWDGFMIDITDRKLAEQELEKTRRQQGILIKILQIVQSADNISDALKFSLAEMGKYTGVSRVYIFEKNTNGTLVSNTYEWCNDGIEPAIDGLLNIPVEFTQPWFDIFNSGEYICTSDITTLPTEVADFLSAQGVKSIVVFPLAANGANYGFVGFDECVMQREWEPSEVELLVSLSQIISTTTRRHQAETSMHLSQQTMRTVLDNINADIYVADFDSWDILFANKKIKESIGGNVEGKTCWQVLQKGQTAPCEYCPNPKLRDEENRPTGIHRWEHWNGNTKKWYECIDAAIEWVDGRLVHMEYATDITDRKAAEEAVRQSEEMYRQLTVASPDAIVVCSPAGKLMYASPKALILFGVDENADINNMRMQQYVHSHDRRQAYNMFGVLVKDNVAFLPQLLLVRRDGSEFFGEISSATVKDSGGQTKSIIMVIRDVTQRKLSEMELIKAKEKAEESDKLKSAFLANMSHEIRTPINGIIGFLNFLGSDTLSPRRRQEYINVINNSSVQLVKLIDDIIDVAKIEAKQMNIRPLPFRVNELMRELHIFFETYLQANNKDRIALILDDSEFIDSCVTYVDPMRLRQVLNNLIGNAIKFTEKGFIRFAYRQPAPNMLEFVVEDSGIGLAPSQLEIIFERFRQAELSNSRRYGGTGLGLTISRSLVQLMGGDMHVESVENAGSSFYFTISYLPVASGDERFFDDTSDEPVTGTAAANKTVLIVAPEIMKYKYAEKLLASHNISAIRAENVQQWLDHISQTNHIDVVVADVSVFGSEEDCEKVKQVKSVRAGLPTVLVVPEQKDKYHQVIRDCQSNATLEEPIDSGKLLDAVKKYLR